MDPYIGEIKLLAFDFAPQGWALCNGQSLQVSTNQALYSLIGTFYGGVPGQSFQLPDLRGRVPVHKGTTPTIGTKGGSETVTLTTAQVPLHTHYVGVNTDAGNQNSGLGNHIAAPVTSTAPINNLNLYGPAGAGSTQVALDQTTGTTTVPTVSSAGAGVAHDNMQPYLTLNYCIATAGIYPSRN